VDKCLDRWINKVINVSFCFRASRHSGIEVEMNEKPLMIMITAEVADYLRVHPSTVYKLLRQGNIPAMRIGSDWRFNKSDLDEWMTRKTFPSK
jgi:excisionase family DNA binding protein